MLDEWERPVTLLRWSDALGGTAPTTVPMCVKAGEAVSELARRAMTRRRSWRYDPLLWCDALGRLQGAVPVEHLVERLAVPDRPQ